MSNNINIVLFTRKREGVVKMNYEKIAEIVHELVKSSRNISLQEQGLPSAELNFRNIQRECAQPTNDSQNRV
ncbi:hypothetical protein ACHOLT_00455 [Desulfitobacterium sp. Sab5]|uniref:hypothetical protein n=1 Tax=Desulfitobacterium nosdiversum TaxID=3375356 RepID=UPI003CE80C78